MKVNRNQRTGGFLPGQSGNPGGRPRMDVRVRDMARDYSEEVLQTLIDISRNPKTQASARVQACNAILDRGWGKPAQMNVNINPGHSYIDFLEQIVEMERVEELLEPQQLPNGDIEAVRKLL